MRFLISLFLLAGAEVTAADAPTFVIVNKTPTFTVTNKTSTKSTVLTYPELVDRVRKGERLTLAIGVSDAADGYVVSLAGFTPGVYDCYPINGVPSMEPRRLSAPVIRRVGTTDCPDGNCPATPGARRLFP